MERAPLARKIADRSPSRAWLADSGVAVLVVALAGALYIATLLPGIGSGDTAEFQHVLPTLGVAHPTGYPLYTLLGWLWSQLPVGSPAWRVSLFSAVAAACAVGVLYAVARAVGQLRGVAIVVALTLAASRTFWSQATIAEVYALAALIQALLLLALVRWRAGQWPLWLAGLLLGLGLAHHRTIVLMIPGTLLFVGLEARGWRLTHAGAQQASSLKSQASYAALAGLAGCLLYLYLPLRAPAWLDSWRTFLRFIAGSDALGAWLQVAEPWQVAQEHLRELVARWIWPQFTPIGVLLGLVGLVAAWRRDRALAALLTLSYLLVLIFCVLFFVQDVDVFLITAHLIAALLIGEGAMALSKVANRWLGGIGSRNNREPRTQNQLSMSYPWFSVLGSRLAWLLIILPALLVWQNLPAIRAANTNVSELAARALISQPLPPGALLIVDWEAVEGLRYLQVLEGIRPDLEVRPLNADTVRQEVGAALAAGRATYLLRAQPNLGLAQQPEGRLWRVSDQPLHLTTATKISRAWQDGLMLKGYTLAGGPYRPGDIVPVTLAWQAGAGPRQRYTMFVHLVGADGALWGQHDREPLPLPTDQWPAGARVVDLYGPTLRLDTPPGRYQVVVGWYSYPSLARLPRDDGSDRLVLGQIDVVPLR